MAKPVRYRIIERNVQRLAAPVGPMADMLNDVTKKAKTLAKASAPSRSGTLRRGININYAKPNGYLRLQGVLYANARHALWVHDGTTGPIKATGGGFMRVPQNRRSPVRGAALPNKQVLAKRSVRGQRSQPFLSTAIRKALVAEQRVSQIGANRL